MTAPAELETGAVREVLGAVRRLCAALEESAGLPLDALVPAGAALDGIENAQRELVRAGEDVRSRLSAFDGRMRSAIARARSLRRFSERGVADTWAAVRRTLDDDPARAARMLLAEFVAGLAAEQTLACHRLADVAVREPRLASAGAAMSAVAHAVDEQRWDRAAPALDLLVATLPLRSGRRFRLLEEIERDVAVLSALFLVRGGHPDDALRLLTDRLEVRADPRLHAERAFLLLRLGRSAEAAEEAADAVDSAPDLGEGYLAQGAVAEARSEFTAAVDSYREGLKHLELVRLEAPERGSLLDATGLLYREVARALESTGLPDAALLACDRALGLGVRGPELYPDTDVFRIRFRLLTALGTDDPLMQQSAYEAARRLLWSDSPPREILPLLDGVVAKKDPARHPLAGWLLAEALRYVAWEGGQPPEAQAIAPAEREWSSWTALAGAPPAGESWVYYSGANIAEDLAYAEPTKAIDTDHMWDALLRIEKALLLDPNDAGSWATEARVLGRLALTIPSREAAQQAWNLNPENMEAGVELIRAYIRTSEFQQALSLAEQFAASLPSPWFLVVRAWLKQRLGDVDGARDDIDEAGDAVEKEGWMLDVRATIRLRTGDRAGALADLTAELALEGQSSDDQLRRAQAAAVLGRGAQAWAALDRITPLAEHLSMEDALEYWSTRVLVEACTGAATDAVGHAREVPKYAQNDEDLASARRLWEDGVALLEHAGRGGGTEVEALRAAAEAIASLAPRGVLTEDEQFAWLLRRKEGSERARVALLAARTRRRVQTGRLHEAVADYESLAGSPFEPEASTALTDVRRALLREAVRTGDAAAAGELHDALAAVSASPYVSRELAVSEALTSVGRLQQAEELLLPATRHPDAATRAQADLRTGMLRAEQQNLEGGLQSLESARDAARESGNRELEGRVDVRLGVVLAARGADTAEVAAHLEHALAALSKDAAVDPAFTVEFEIRLAARSVRLASTRTLRDAYEQACATHGMPPAPWGLD